MKRLFAILTTLVLLLNATPVLADPGAADVVMEGETYHLTLTDVGIVDGKLTVVMEGFGSNLRIGANGPMIAGLPEAHYGDEAVSCTDLNMIAGGSFTFTFERDDLPDEIWITSYDDGVDPVLIWQAGDIEAPGEDPAASIPAELVGEWKGVGTPKDGGTPIDLTITVNAGGSGEYTFDQGSYHESYPFTISNGDSTFSADIPATSMLGSVGGTWALEDGFLKLDITTEFAGGGSYSYTAVCEKAEEEAVSSDAPGASGVSGIQPVVPHIQPIVPHIQPIVPHIQPVVPHIQPVVPHIQPVVPHIPAASEAARESAAEDGNGDTEEANPAPESADETSAEPTEEPSPESAAEKPTALSGAQSELIQAVLDALNDDACRATYDALSAGEVVRKGSKGDAAKGVQQTLAAFGQKIAVDGNVGPRTIAALNAVQAAFGLEQTEALDAEGYAGLLPRLLISTDPDKADALLSDQMESGEYDYMRACALVARGKYFSARQLFERSAYGDWEARAEACVQPWPRNGVLYKNPAVKGSSTELTVKFNTDPDTAMLVKVYTTDGTLARTLFIGGTGKATTSLPAGTYIIKDGTGRNWYGEEEAFGQRPEGYYEIMTFDNGAQEVQLKKNYSSTITVNVQEGDPTGKGVGADREDWEDF